MPVVLANIQRKPLNRPAGKIVYYESSKGYGLTLAFLIMLFMNVTYIMDRSVKIPDSNGP